MNGFEVEANLPFKFHQKDWRRSYSSAQAVGLAESQREIKADLLWNSMKFGVHEAPFVRTNVC